MIEFSTVLLGITVLFAVFLVLRSLFSVKVCALCAAVATTWIILVVLFYLGTNINLTLVGILMGGSVVGVMYLLEQKLPADFLIFKLSFFLSLVTIVYFILERSVSYRGLMVVASVWILSFVIYANRNTGKFRSIGTKTIECCKNW